MFNIKEYVAKEIGIFSKKPIRAKFNDCCIASILKKYHELMAFITENPPIMLKYRVGDTVCWTTTTNDVNITYHTGTVTRISINIDNDRQRIDYVVYDSINSYHREEHEIWVDFREAVLARIANLYPANEETENATSN